MRATIVIPTYNEVENLRSLVERIATLRIPDLTILIVDDNSPDGTGVLADELAREYAFVRVTHRAHKEGIGAAYIAGFKRAIVDGAKVIIQMDADGSHDPGVIPLMIEYLYSQASFRGHAEESRMHVRASHDVRSLASARDDEKTIDVVIGSRRVAGGRILGWGWHRRLTSWSAQALARLLLGFRTRDVTSGFRAWKTETLRAALDYSPPQLPLPSGGGEKGKRILASGYAFQEAMLYRAEQFDARIVEHPITFRDRERGRSKLGWRDVLEFFQTLACLWIGAKDRRFALWIGIVLVLLTGFPYLYGWFMAPPGMTYTSLHAISSGDAHVYYSYIEQARDGRYVFDDLFTSEAAGGRMVQPYWLLVGLFARATHLSAPLAFHLTRLLLIIPFMMTLAAFVATFLRRPIGGFAVRTLRRFTLLAIAFSGGLGGLLGGALLPFAHDAPAHSAWVIDLWVPEAFTFLALYQSGHLIVSVWLMLVIYFATIRADETRRLRWTAVAAVAAFALTAMHPFYIPFVPAIIAVHAAVRMIVARRWLVHLAHHVAWVALATLPAFAYWGPLALLDPIHHSRAAQNILSMPPLPFVLVGYGLLLPLGLAGCAAFIRRWRTVTTAEQFLVVWALVNIVFIWAPLPWQRRFTQGLQVALVLAGVVVVAHGVVWFRRRLPVRWHSIVCTRATAIVLFILLGAFSNIVNIARDIAYYSHPPPSAAAEYRFYHPSAGFDAMRWLRQYAPREAVTLAYGASANFLPGRAARRVYLGHTFETAQFTTKNAAYRAFLEPARSLTERRAFLAVNNIHFLFVARFEPSGAALEDVAQKLRLPKVFENNAAAIYESRPL